MYLNILANWCTEYWLPYVFNLPTYFYALLKQGLKRTCHTNGLLKNRLKQKTSSPWTWFSPSLWYKHKSTLFLELHYLQVTIWKLLFHNFLLDFNGCKCMLHIYSSVTILEHKICNCGVFFIKWRHFSYKIVSVNLA